MEIKLTKEEFDKITSILGEAPAKYTFDLIKFFETKLTQAIKAAESDKAEEPIVENA